MTYHNIRLSTSDWVLIGYLIGILAYFVVDVLRADEPAPTGWTEQSYTLTEDHLQHLENGESVRIGRWHGTELVLDGTLVVDVTDEQEEV